MLRGFRPRRGFSEDPETAWGQNNIAFLPFAIVVWVVLDHYDPSITWGAYFVMLFAVARTTVDYWVGWPFYFPKLERAPAPPEPEIAQTAAL